MMATALASLCVLVLAGALLHLAWRIALAALLWAPSGAAGLVAGWYVAQGFDTIALGVAAAISAAALVRLALFRLWVWVLAPRGIALLVWEDAP